MNSVPAQSADNVSEKEIPTGELQKDATIPLNGSASATKIIHSIRIMELDGLRGVAILLVISFHYLNNQLFDSGNKWGQLVASGTQFGWLGVDLFFILSGFLIGTILIANKHSQNFFKTFFVRRVVRIVPNYFLLLICFTIIWKFGLFSNNIYLWENNTIPLWSYYAMLHNVYMAIQNSFGNNALTITWSIGVEEQFYIIFPFVVYFLNVRLLPFVLAALIVFAPIFRAQFHTWLPTYVVLPARLDGLCMGFLIAWLNNKGLLLAHKKQLTKFLILEIIVVTLACGYFYWKYDDLGPVKHTLFALIFSGFVILALIQPKSNYAALLRTKALVWIGQISYSLYLFHTLVLGLAHEFTVGKTNRIRSIADIAVTIAAFFVSLLLSWLIYSWLEKPMVMIGKKFRY